jgi:hypothetical protein
MTPFTPKAEYLIVGTSENCRQLYYRTAVQGNYPVKPMQFSYFDLNLGKYKTISATEVMVTVLDGPTLTDATASNEENSKDKISSKSNSSLSS